jgi:uncharacterized protein (TIGR03437 family)
MNRYFAILALVLVACAGMHAATTNTTLTVTNAVGALGATGAQVSGPATLSGIGSGTFTGTLPLTPDSSGNLSGTFAINVTTGTTGTITGALKIPASALTGTFAGSATITGGTGNFAGATGSFTANSGSLSLIPTLTLSFVATGSITTGGSPGGPPAPTITSVMNNYGLIAPGLPNYAIAPSALFFITGTGLSNSTTALLSSADPGLPTTMNNVSVSVTSGGTTKQCTLYYLSPTQIDAVLPGSTATGNATITVTNNGATSAAFTIVVAQSAFGILSYNGNLGAVYDANNNIITASNSANPNQAIVLWGSGVGFDPADDDKLYPQKQDNLTSIPMTVYVGGISATIAYRGRSQFPGVDQVVITIPGNVTPGCFVSLAVVSGNIVSNTVTIPIAASGKTCSDTNSGITPDLILNLSGKTTIKTGFLSVSQVTSITGIAGTQTTNTVFGGFQSVTGFANSVAATQVSIGSCLVYTAVSAGAGTSTGLDAGASISVTGPAGNATLSPLNFPGLGVGFYGPPNGTAPAGFITANGGSYTFDNGSGGKDVGHFNASVNMPPAFTWTNSAQVGPVTRSQGANVTWSGGAPGSTVMINGTASAKINGTNTVVSFICQAPQSAGQFAIPVPVLLALPADANGTLSVSDATNQTLFQASGLDIGVLQGSSLTSKLLAYN